MESRPRHQDNFSSGFDRITIGGQFPMIPSRNNSDTKWNWTLRRAAVNANSQPGLPPGQEVIGCSRVSVDELRKPPASERFGTPIFGPGAAPLLDCHQAAEYLGVHPRTLQRMVLRGEISAVRVGKLYRFVPSALQEWVLRHNLAS